MKRALPPRVHRKRGRGGQVYLYFNTGRRNAAGKPILARLPDYASNGFGRAYAACLDAMSDPEPSQDQLTVPQLCERFRRSARFRNRAKGTQESYLTYLRVIEDNLDTFLAEEVEPGDVLALMEKLRDRPAAANQTVRTLSALYAWARDPTVALVKHNPAARIELNEGGEYDPWPEWLVEKALRSDDTRISLLVHLLYFTAARIGDVSRMLWTDIEDDHWLLKQGKTGEPLEIPLHQRLRAVLKKTPRSLTTVIHRPDGKPYSRETLRVWLQEFAAKHGVKVVAHGLRKNAVNALLELGCSVAQTQAISGQSLQMIEHYAHKRNKRKLAGAAMKMWENEQ